MYSIDIENFEKKTRDDGTVYYEGTSSTLFDMEANDPNFYVVSPTLTLQKGKNGQLSFTILPDHPLYNKLVKMKTIVKVYGDTHILFYGRINNTSIDFYKQMKVECEGALGFLNDSLVDKLLNKTETKISCIDRLLEKHNNQVEDWKKIYRGNVILKGIDNENNKKKYGSSSYTTTMSSLSSLILNKEKAEATVRYNESDGKLYLDICADAERTETPKSNQIIEFGENIINLSNSSDGNNAFTVLLPIGKKGKTIANAAAFGTSDSEIIHEKQGLYLIVSREAIEHFGWIVHIENFSDVSDVDELVEKGKTFIKDYYHKEPANLTVTALDFSVIDGDDPIEVGDEVRIISKPHGIDAMYPCQSIKYDLLNPEKNEYNFTKKSLSQTGGTNSAAGATNGGITSISSDNIKWNNDQVTINSKEIEINASNMLKLLSEGGTVEIDGKIIQIGDKVSPEYSSSEVLNDPQTIKIGTTYANTADGASKAYKLITQISQSEQGITAFVGRTEGAYSDAQKALVDSGKNSTWIAAFGITDKNITSWVGGVQDATEAVTDPNSALNKKLNGTYITQDNGVIQSIVIDNQQISSYIKQTAESITISADKIDLNGIVQHIQGTSLFLANSITAPAYYVGYGKEDPLDYNIMTHHHSFTVGTGDDYGKIFIGDARFDSPNDKSFFNIADTQFYKDVTVSSVSASAPSEKDFTLEEYTDTYYLSTGLSMNVSNGKTVSKSISINMNSVLPKIQGTVYVNSVTIPALSGDVTENEDKTRYTVKADITAALSSGLNPYSSTNHIIDVTAVWNTAYQAGIRQGGSSGGEYSKSAFSCKIANQEQYKTPGTAYSKTFNLRPNNGISITRIHTSGQAKERILHQTYRNNTWVTAQTLIAQTDEVKYLTYTKNDYSALYVAGNRLDISYTPSTSGGVYDPSAS